MKGRALSPDELAKVNEQRAGQGLDPLASTVTPPADTLSEWRDVQAPATQDELRAVIHKAVARVLELATKPKELTEAIEAATEWYKIAYAKDGDGDGLGSRLVPSGGNGHGG